jgi:hypothetical protein
MKRTEIYRAARRVVQAIYGIAADDDDLYLLSGCVRMCQCTRPQAQQLVAFRREYRAAQPLTRME